MTARFAAIVAALGCLSTAAAQGRADYFNVETPVGQALALARIANHDYLLVCNTPDNSVEIYDTDEGPQAGLPLLARVPVGLEPNSILWDGSRSRVFVTCFLGDSVESFALTAASGPASLTVSLDHARNVGDEPMDLALTPDNQTLLVSFGSKSALGAFAPLTLDPVAASTAFPAPTDNLVLQTSSADLVVKEPRTVAVSGSTLVVLNHKGGTTLANPFGGTDYDFDLYVRDLGTGAVAALGNLGSSNWNMRFASNGDLYVVSGLARIDLIGGGNVAGAKTGFVTSMLHRVTSVAGSAGFLSRDLNLVGSSAVTKADALAMPTDLVVLEPAGGPTKVYVAAFGSDRVGVITLVDPNDPSTWTIGRIAIPVAPFSTNPRSGPRALVHKTAIIGTASDPGERIYVLNRLDASVTILVPQSGNVETFALAQDPTPEHIRVGREFLYSAEHSGNGFVSCASCHADGRTDALGWDLGSPLGFAAPFAQSFVDSPSGATLIDIDAHLLNGFNPNKGVMVTQTLQGLLDTEVDPENQDLVTNAPYHWRGDRALFTDFNEGFANLLGLGDLFGGGGPGDLPMGIHPDDMEAFEEFVNSIHYPPNPQQMEDRVYTGGLGLPDTLVSDGGSLALRGMKVFHIQRLGNGVGGGRSCVGCHSLPRGSNLKWTDSTADADEETTPLETAQLRGLFQRERRFQPDHLTGGPLAGMFGLTHTGGRGTINAFNNLFGLPDPDTEDLNRFIHEFDWGVAPIVGRELRVTKDDLLQDPGAVNDRIGEFEAQVQLGNCGLAVGGNASGTPIGYWYDPTQDLYVEESSSGTNAVPRSTLTGLVTGLRHRLFFRCTPLGSERRVAALDGSATSLSGTVDPANLELLPMAPILAWSLVPTMDKNWIPGTNPGDFKWVHATDPNMPTPRFLRAIRQFQHGLINATNDYGLTALRHDAPRRFRVSGDNILAGAKLVLWTPLDTTGAAPDTTQTAPDPAKTRRIELPLHATGQMNGESPIWETAVQLAPLQYYALLNGGVEAPGVRDALDDAFSTLPEPLTTLDPDDYNWHFVEVVNPDDDTGDCGWQQLTLQ